MASGSRSGSHTESQIVRERDDLQLILDTIPEFVFYKDTHNNMLRVNRAAAESVGATPEQMAGSPTSSWYPDLADQYFEDDLRVIRSGQPRVGIIETIRNSEGEARWVETDKFPLNNELGKVTGVLVVARDITERRRLEETLQRTQRLDSIGRLAGGVAHDFNNLLTVMLGHLELADEHASGPSPLSDSLDAVKLAIQRGADLTGQLLTFARQQVHSPSIVDLNDVVSDSCRLLRRVIEESIDFTIRLEADPVLASVDPGQLSQVIINMAINARDAMPRGGTLTIQTSRGVLNENAGSSLPPGTYAAITIIDTGEGISEDEQRHLFEPFFTTKDVGTGTGLGLATAYGIVQRNGGDILVESRAGLGSVFRIYLPQAEPAPQRKAPELVDAGTQGHGETVLFVEDDEILRKLGASVLTRSGYSVVTACDGEDALHVATAENSSFEILVTDVVMPRMGGPRLAEILRRTRPDLKVLYMSGYAEAGLVQEGSLEMGEELLTKPFTRKELLLRVARELGHQPGSTPA